MRTWTRFEWCFSFSPPRLVIAWDAEATRAGSMWSALQSFHNDCGDPAP